MIVLIAGVIGSGFVTAALLMPFSPLAALIMTPVVASAMALLAGLFLARQRRIGAWRTATLDMQPEARISGSVPVAAPANSPALRQEAA